MRVWMEAVQNERGMALILSIVVMAAMALMAIASTVDNTIEVRIASNQQTSEVAFRHAEAGLERARQFVSSQFATNPINLARIRTGAGTPNWSFLFQGSPTADPDASTRYDEVLLNLGANDQYKVFAHYPEDRNKDNVFLPAGATGNDLALRSVGFGPGGAEKVIEVTVTAAAAESRYTSYAQEGGGATKTNTNIQDSNAVQAGSVASGLR